MSLRRCGKSFFVVEAEDSSQIQDDEKSDKPPPGASTLRSLFFIWM